MYIAFALRRLVIDYSRYAPYFPQTHSFILRIHVSFPSCSLPSCDPSSFQAQPKPPVPWHPGYSCLLHSGWNLRLLSYRLALPEDVSSKNTVYIASPRMSISPRDWASCLMLLLNLPWHSGDIICKAVCFVLEPLLTGGQMEASQVVGWVRGNLGWKFAKFSLRKKCLIMNLWHESERMKMVFEG